VQLDVSAEEEALLLGAAEQLGVLVGVLLGATIKDRSHQQPSFSRNFGLETF
jgi:hypothetical protein